MAPIKDWALTYRYKSLSDKIKQRKNIATYTPLAAAAGYGIKTLVDNRNKTLDELHKKALTHTPTD
jgi:hypothetical protein